MASKGAGKRSTKGPSMSQGLPTLSYKQLQTEYATMHETINELQSKITKQQQTVQNAKFSSKKFEKENKDLTQRLKDVETHNKENLEKLTEEWTSKNSQLATKLDSCERQLDKMGVDPVSLEILEKKQNEEAESRSKTAEQARILKEKLLENVEITKQNFAKLEEISMQCQGILQTDAEI